jgi:hypothetical protein
MSTGGVAPPAIRLKPNGSRSEIPTLRATTNCKPANTQLNRCSAGEAHDFSRGRMSLPTAPAVEVDTPPVPSLTARQPP